MKKIPQKLLALAAFFLIAAALFIPLALASWQPHLPAHPTLYSNNIVPKDTEALSIGDEVTLTTIKGRSLEITTDKTELSEGNLIVQGRVGIGNSNPQGTLHLTFQGASNIPLIDSGTTQSGLIVKTANSNAKQIVLRDSQTSGDSQVMIGSKGDGLQVFTGGAQTLVVDANGNVGIGSQNPANALEVVGTVKASNFVDQSDQPIGGGAFAEDNGNAIRAMGSVGIGTTSPDSPLHIKTGQVQNFVKIEAEGNNHAGVIFRNGAEPNNLIFTEGSTGNLKIQTANSDRLIIDRSGNVGIGSPNPTQLLHLEGSNSPSVLVKDSTNGVATKLLADDEGGWIGTETNNPLLIGTNNIENIRITTEGGVGIGTTSPGLNKLSVLGNAKIDGNLEVTGTLQSSNLAGITTQIQNEIAAASTWSRSGSILFYDSGSVGIGTTTPRDLLHIKGFVPRRTLVPSLPDTPLNTDQGYARVTVENVDTNAAGFISKNSENEFFAGIDNGGFTIYDNVNVGSRLFITADGNIGIGTTTPSAALDVAGSIVASEFVKRDGTPLAAPDLWEELNGNIYRNSGSVGIGATSPDTVVHIAGADDDAFGQLKVESSGNDARISLYNTNGLTAGTRGDILMSRTTGSEGLRFMTNDQDRMIIAETGNIGIGTTNPAAALDVVGEIKSSGANYIRNPGPTLFLQDTDHRSAMVHVNSNQFYVLRGAAVDAATWEATGGRWPLQIDLESNQAVFGGNLHAQGLITSDTGLNKATCLWAPIDTHGAATCPTGYYQAGMCLTNHNGGCNPGVVTGSGSPYTTAGGIYCCRP